MKHSRTADRIHLKFERWRSRIHARFERMRRWIHEVTDVVLVTIRGVVETIGAVAIEIVRLGGVMIQLLVLIVALSLMVLFGVELGGLWGWVIIIVVSAIPVILLISMVSTRGTDTDEGTRESELSQGSHTPLRFFLFIMLLVAVSTFVVYFSYRQPRLKLLTPAYSAFIQLKSLVPGHRSARLHLLPNERTNSFLHVETGERILLECTNPLVLSIESDTSVVYSKTVTPGTAEIFAPHSGIIAFVSPQSDNLVSLKVLPQSIRSRRP